MEQDKNKQMKLEREDSEDSSLSSDEETEEQRKKVGEYIVP